MLAWTKSRWFRVSNCVVFQLYFSLKTKLVTSGPDYFCKLDCECVGGGQTGGGGNLEKMSPLPARGKLGRGIRKTPYGKFRVEVRINGKVKRGGTFPTLEEAKARRYQLRNEQLDAAKAKKVAAGAQNDTNPDDAERQAMQQRTDAGLKAIHDAIEQVEKAHAQKVKAAQRAVLEEQASHNRKWKRVPLEAFEPVKDDTRPKLTDMQVVMLCCCFVEASSAGKVRFSIRNNGKNSWRAHRTFGSVQQGYMHVTIGGILFKVHHLCCWTFHGAPPEKGATADHIYHCMRDNRASQLRWATQSQQITNQRPHRTHIDTWPVEVKVAEDSAWAWYRGAGACAEATGVNVGSLSNLLHEVGTSVGGLFAVRRGAAFEVQTDLPPKPVQFQGQTRYLKAEEWRVVPRAPDWRVSTHGRAQKRSGAHWSPRFTPRAGMASGRVRIMINGNHEQFYNVIWRTFCEELARGHTVDHIDQDCDNNCLYNLRSTTDDEQKLNQSTTRPSNVKVIACANPDQFLADKAASDAASAAAIAAAAATRGSDSTCTVFTKEQTMAAVVAAAKRVRAKETDDGGRPARMPSQSETGGKLWMSMKSTFTRGKEFAKAMGDWSEKEARDFITAHTSVKLSDTPNAVRHRARTAGAKKRKRASLEAE